MISTALVEKAKSIGFIAVGFTGPDRPPYFDHFTAWLAAGKNADMTWLSRNLEVREAPSRILENCLTVISLAYPYPDVKPQTKDGFSVARYVDPTRKDYHTRLRSLSRKLISFIEETFPGSRSRACVDSAPVLERSLAVAGGVGFLGKNNLLIVPGYGSYVYLVEIFTTAPIPFAPVAPVPASCGLCTLCLDACPTGALEGPFAFNASKCLSYLTVEYRGDLNEDLSEKMERCFFGCDRCQEVCPFNGGRVTSEAVLPSTRELLDMEEAMFRERFGKTAFARTGIEKLKSNIRAARKGC
jgi:epoxyqueuosine reductase